MTVRTRLAGFAFLCALAPLSEGGATSAAEVRSIVDDAVKSSTQPRERALADLLGLGADAIPALIEVFSGRDLLALEPAEISDTPRFEVPPPPSWLQGVLLETLDAQNDKLLALEVSRFVEGATLEERLLCFQIVHEMEGREAIDTWITLVDDIPKLRLKSTFVSAPAERALGALLQETPRAVDQLAKRVEDIDPLLYGTLARAVGISKNHEGLEVLADLMGVNDATDLVCLREAGRLEPFEDELRVHKARFLSDSLGHEDPRYRSEAAVALMRLRATWTIDRILPLLEDDSRAVRNGALWGLRHISTQEWSADPRRWNDWWQAEQEWLQTGYEEALRDLGSNDPALTMSAVDELSRHPVYSGVVKRALQLVHPPNETVRERIDAVLEKLAKR